MKRLRQQRKTSNRPQRAGFTLIELMVVVAIIAVLIGIITPAVQSARASARNAQCLNNIRNVALAINNVATSNNGKYPYLEDGTYGWPVRILDRFDQAALAREIRTAGMPSPVPVVASFTCPDDQVSSGEPGGLSYAVNSGYFRRGDWGQAADLDHNPNLISYSFSTQNIGRSTGVISRSASDRFRMTMDFVSQGDGTSSTLLLAENIQSQNWPSQFTSDIAFGLSITTVSAMGGDFPLGGSATGKFVSTAGNELKFLPEFELTDGPGSNDARINSNPSASVGTSPRPSSNHGGTVNVTYCDGHAISLDAAIDSKVYARILTPNGANFGQIID